MLSFNDVYDVVFIINVKNYDMYTCPQIHGIIWCIFITKECALTYYVFPQLTPA